MLAAKAHLRILLKPAFELELWLQLDLVYVDHLEKIFEDTL